MALSRAVLNARLFHQSVSRLASTSIGSYQQQQAGEPATQGASTWQPPPFPPIQTIHLADAQALANRVQLTGNLGADLERVESDEGLIGKVNLFVQSNARDRNVADIYTLELYGSLAADAYGKLRKGMAVNVVGRLWVEKFTDRAGAGKLRMIVEAEEIVAAAPKSSDSEPKAETRVMPAPQAPPPPQQAQQQQQQQARPAPQSPPSSAAPADSEAGGPPRKAFTKLTSDREAELWAELKDYPKNFWDNRVNKRNPKAPDFKHKQTGEGIWLSSRAAPAWAQE